jgi:hypothetical protein
MKKHAIYGIFAVVSLLGLGITQSAKATNLIQNGDFETGTFADWTVVDQAGGSGSWFISNPGANTPISGMPTAANGSGGNFYAVTDQPGPGCHVLLQSFTLAPGHGNVSLSFQMFVNNWNGGAPIINPAGLDYTAFPNEHGRVDILSSSAGAFDTGAGVVENLYIGSDPSAPNPYLTYTFDLSNLAAGTYQLRFAEVDNQFFFNEGVDNVSLSVPDSGTTVVLLGAALMVVGLVHRRLAAKRA